MGHDVTVLVVDDDGDSVEAMREILSAEGHRVLTAMNGRDALELTRREHPDLVLLDLEMPGMDGRSFLSELRSHADVSDVPVVVVSGAVDAGDLGTESVRKPLRLDTLLGLIERVAMAGA
jgi:CheY-like chemotaxis protein